MTLKSSPKTTREKRREARAARRRNLILFISLAALIIIGVLAAFVYFSQPQAGETNMDSGEAVTGADPNFEVIKMDSGLEYQDLVVGNGETADSGDTVAVHYTGWLTDGTKFDSSLERGSPFTFTIDRGSVIQGWHEGIRGMKVGGKRRLIIPSDLAYGDDGYAGVIPPKATLIFDVELVEMVK